MDSSTPLALRDVAESPSLLTWQVTLPAGEVVTVRPLAAQDVYALASFLDGLSSETRYFWYLASYDLAQAQAMCDAIARYDKLRFAVQETGSQGAIIGLLEFSFDLTDDDRRRYAGYGIDLVDGRDCRFGPCLADAYQGKGAAAAIFPHMVEVASRFGQRRILLWGGVLEDNRRAIRFYEKMGFQRAGAFVDADGLAFQDMLYVIDL